MCRLIGIVLLLSGAPLFAVIPELDERTPFRHGLWWNPDRPGSGIDIHRSSDGVFLVWYTFRQDGSPVWFTAQGALHQGRFQSDLLEHRAVDGIHADFSVAGQVSLDIRRPETIEFAWTLGQDQGEWMVQPYVVDGPAIDVDHSGAWFQVDRPGHGLTLSEQGSFLLAALMYFDAGGRAVWRAGHRSIGETRVALHRFVGSCPSCDHQPSFATDVIDIDVTLLDEHRIEVAASASAAAQLPFTSGAQTLSLLTAAHSVRRADRMMVRLADDQVLGGLLRRGLVNIADMPRSGSENLALILTPSPFAQDGAVSIAAREIPWRDALSLLVSDETSVYALGLVSAFRDRGRLLVAPRHSASASLVEAVPYDIDLDLAPGFPRPEGMALGGDRLVVVHGSAVTLGNAAEAVWPDPWKWTRGAIQVDVFEVGADQNLTPAWRALIDGYLLAGWLEDNHLLLLHRYVPFVDGLVSSSGTAHGRDANAQLVDAVSLSALLPGIRVAGEDREILVDAERVLLPPEGDREERSDLILLTRIDLRDPGSRESIGVFGGVDGVHVSTDAVYVASNRHRLLEDQESGLYRSAFNLTDLHKFAAIGDRWQYLATGTVLGSLHRDPDRAGQRMGTFDGRVLAFTESSDGIWGEQGPYRLNLLEPSVSNPTALRNVSSLPNQSRPQPLAESSGDPPTTRFVHDRLYLVPPDESQAVTLLDLADGDDPRVAGTAVLPGFAHFLQPLPQGRLLAFGGDRAAGSHGQFETLRLSLFDMSDASQPRTLESLEFGRRGSGSALLRHRQAFSLIEGEDGELLRVAIPMALHGLDEGDAPPAEQPYPWSISGLFLFELGNEHILELDPLVARDAAQGDSTGILDGGRWDGRSLLFPDDSVYLDEERLWFGASTVSPHVLGAH